MSTRTAQSAALRPIETTPAIEVLGARTCEDTAIVRSRLDALGVAYGYRDVDEEPAALDRVRACNGGHRITPTVVAGDVAIAEPTLERLGELLATTGAPAFVAEPVQLHGDITASPVPWRSRPDDTGAPFVLGSLVGHRQVCLFLAHGADCLACLGYARQLAGRREALDAAETTLVIVVADAHPELAAWRHGLPPEAILLADADGALRGPIAACLGLEPGGVSLVLLDRFLAPRVRASADEAGGLPDASSALSWLDYLTLECPECSGELPWPPH